MNKSKNTILVTGATGQQGGAVARHLLHHDWQVRALTRDVSSREAEALAEVGAEVVQGNLNNAASLEPAMHGVYGVFSVQPPLLGQNNDEGYDAEQEVEQGKRLGDLAQAAGVKHFVYSSAGGADRNSPLPHVNSKWQVEQYLRALDLPLTVIYPVFFMENFNWNRQEITGGQLTVALKPETRLQMLAVDDIGAFVALAFSRPDEYIGKGFELAGDELTMPQAAAIFARVTGRPVGFVEQPLEELASFSPEMAEMMQEFNLKPNQANISDLRRRHPGLMTLEQWLQASSW